MKCVHLLNDYWIPIRRKKWTISMHFANSAIFYSLFYPKNTNISHLKSRHSINNVELSFDKQHTLGIGILHIDACWVQWSNARPVQCTVYFCYSELSQFIHYKITPWSVQPQPNFPRRIILIYLFCIIIILIVYW